MTKIMLPVIHYLDDDQAYRNAKLAFDTGADGVLLIEMNGNNERLGHVGNRIKTAFPDKMIGINHLSRDAEEGMRKNIAYDLDMTWTDRQLTHSSLAEENWKMARKLRLLNSKHPSHKLFVGVAFKYQASEPDPVTAALKAQELGFIPTTSGTATGISADVEKVKTIKEALNGGDLAIASGITPENVHDYLPYVTHYLVAVGISKDFHNFDRAKLIRLRDSLDGI
jgi:predicted TIM-barrel enzyme